MSLIPEGRIRRILFLTVLTQNVVNKIGKTYEEQLLRSFNGLFPGQPGLAGTRKGEPFS